MEENFLTRESRRTATSTTHWGGDISHEYSTEKEIHPEFEDKALLETKMSSNYTYQTQKIIFNDLEENEVPTYKNFFEKDHDNKPAQTVSPKFEDKKEHTPPRWEILYQRAKGIKQAREDLKKEYESQQHDPECTFKPKITLATNTKTFYTVESMEGEPLSVHERNKLWKSRVSNKVSQAREMLKDRDLNGCTFRPDLNKSQTSDLNTQRLTSYGSRGIDLFLKRSIIAKQAQQQKGKIIENPLKKLPSRVYKKEGSVTVPKGPEFHKGKSFEINSLKKPFEFPQPRLLDQHESSPERAMSPQKAVQILVDPIQINNIKFGDAIQMLHYELHRMNC